MAASLADIRKRLQEQEQKQGGNQSRGNDAMFPFWNIPDDSTASLRFLPDENPDNPFFWQERQVIKIPFSGIKGHDEHKEVIVQVPCIEMWGEKCPVHEEIRPWFKDPSLEDVARKYWKKRSYLFQGFVVDSPLQEEAPENPIRRFVINPSIFKIIKAALMDPEFEALPTDYENGIDFKLTKTKDGQYANYTTSNWSRKSRALSENERNAIETHGLVDLNEYMPKRPTSEELAAIVEMFEASVDGQMYDPEKWAAFYSPYGFDNSAYRQDVPAKAQESKPAESKPAPKPQETKAEVKEDIKDAEADLPWNKDEESKTEDKPAEESKPAEDDSTPKANDILAMIRQRQNKG